MGVTGELFYCVKMLGYRLLVNYRMDSNSMSLVRLILDMDYPDAGCRDDAVLACNITMT